MSVAMFSVLAVLAVLAIGLTPTPSRASSVPADLVFLSGWNVGASPRVCENDGAGNWTNCASLPITDGSPDGTSSFESGDWNNDGLTDVVVGNQNGTLNTCIQGVSPTWTCQSNGAAGRHRGIGVGDFDGDGNTDLVGTIETAASMDVCLGDGTGGFSCSRVGAPNGGQDIDVFDVDLDGDVDLVIAAGSQSAVCGNDGSAGFTCSAIAGSAGNVGVDHGDLNGDGHLDLVLSGGADESFCAGDSTGAFTCTPFNTGGGQTQIELADLDGDGDLDAVVGGNGGSTLSCLGDGTGTLTCSVIAAMGTNVTSVDLGHVDGDGVVDAVFGTIGAVNQACSGSGTGQFTCSSIDAPNAWHTQGVLLVSVAAAVDTDGDGSPDTIDNCPSVANADQSDTDLDGLGDPCDTDDDGDGLTDDDEVLVFGTDPLVADTDADGLGDGDEVLVFGTDPSAPDTDLDTLSDHDEVVTIGTDPLAADTDLDGADDGQEVAFGSDPLAPPAAQSLVVAPQQDLTFDLGGFTVAAWSSSGLPPTILASGSCVASGNLVTATGAGSCTVTVSQDGDLSWEAAPIETLDVQILHGIQAISHDPIPPLVFGDAPVTLAAVAGSGLPVAFDAAGACAMAGLDLTITGAGTCTVTFTQGGAADWAPAAPVVVDVGVGQASQVITLTPPLDGAYGGASQPVSATATSGLPVVLSAAGPCRIEGASVVATGTGACTVSAAQPGDADWSPAATVDATFLIAPGAQTVGAVTPVARSFDQAGLTLDASATSGLPVRVVASGTCSATGTDIAFTGAGTCTLTVDQPGDADWLPASPVAVAFTIARGQQALSTEVPSSATYGDADVALIATADSGLPVTATVEGPCSVVAASLHLDGAGTCHLRFEQPGNANWLAANPRTVELVVGRAAQVVSVGALRDVVYGAPPRTVSAAASSGLPVSISVTGPCRIERGRLTTSGVGTCRLAAAQSGNADWLPASTVETPFLVVTARAELFAGSLVVGPSDEPQAAEVWTEPAGLDGVDVRYDGDAEVPSRPGDYELRVTLDNPNYAAEPITTTFTVREPELDLGADDRALSRSVRSLVDDGLPEPAGGRTVLTVTGLDAGTLLSISDGSESIEDRADTDGVAILDIPDGFDLADAVLVIESPDGTATVLSTQNVAVFGDSEVAVDFEIVEGDAAAGAEFQLRGLNLAASSEVRVVVHSDPVELGSVPVDESGALLGRLALPEGLDPGEHRVLVHARTDEGDLTGTWFFAVAEDGALDRVGDPVLESPDEERVAVVPDEPLAFVDDETDEDAAPGEVDPATGLVVYEPATDPERSVDTGVNGYALVASATAAAGSAAAASSMAGRTPTTSGSDAAGSGGGSGDGDEPKKRGKGKLASGKSKGLGDGIEAAAWGDASRTWRWPLVGAVDSLGRSLPDRIRPASPLLARIVADGSTLRAVAGPSALLAHAAAALLGLWAVADTGGQAVAPQLAIVALLLVLGVADASAGLVGVLVFSIGVLVSGGVGSADAMRTLMGLGSIFYALPLLAGGSRSLRRRPAVTMGERWQRVADVVVGSLLGAWTVQTVLKALPGLSGLELPIAEQADRVALLALLALVARYLLEIAAVRLYPERLSRTAPIEDRKAGTRQQVVSILLKAGVFVFVISPYIGLSSPLAAVVALMLGPQFVGLVKDRFPNSRLLHRVMPKGVPAILFFMVVGKSLGAFVGARIEDPARLTAVSFVVMAIPGFVAGVAGLFGRDGDDLETTWLGRLAGAFVAIVTIAAIRGSVSTDPLDALLVLLPALGWWGWAALRAGLRPSQPAEEVGVDEPGTDPSGDAGGPRQLAVAGG